jgi:glycosyltransferase involved in cell wall biosynthesis
MRLAIVTETFLPKMDGIVRTLLELLEYLAANGHEAMVFAPGAGATTVQGFPVFRQPGLRFPLYPELTLAPFAPSLRRRLEDFRPDVVHLAGPCVLGAAGLRAARSLHVPLAAHFQTDLAQYARFFGFGALAPLMWRYLAAVHNACDATYAPTPGLSRALRARGFRNVRVSGRGVDAERFHPCRRSGCAADLLYVGRVSAEKNVDWLVDLAEALPTKRLRIVGDGPGRVPLQRRLTAPNVTFSGELRGTELAEAYASAKLFVFPSHTETFGQVVQEAMASGLPVVGVKAGGVADLVRPGETGLLCPAHDRAAFVGAARRLLCDGQSRARMAANARRFAERQTWQAVFDSLLDDYRELVHRRGAFKP